MKKSIGRAKTLSEQCEILKEYKFGKLTKKQACDLLGVSSATLYRRIKKFEQGGIQALEHGNKGRAPANRMEEGLRSEIAFALQTKYEGFQPALAKKYLQRDMGLRVSEEFLRKLLKEGTSQSQNRTVQLHPPRRRRAQFGELIQIDGSPHHWFGLQKQPCCLIVFIDDATGKITAAGFYETECGEGYFDLISQHVIRYGIPVAFYSDRHCIFTSGPSDGTVNAEENETQYQRICSMLGITPIFAQSPQAKGRVERLNQTLQKRWPKEFAIRGIEDISTANKYIGVFIEEFNEEFAVEPFDKTDAHRPLPAEIGEKEICRICARWYPRRVSKQLTLNFRYQTIHILGVDNRQSLWGKEVFVIVYESGQLEVVYEQRILPIKILAPKEVPKMEPYVETAKTVDQRVEQLKFMEKEKNRRQTWLNARAARAKRALDIREELIEAAEAVAKEPIVSGKARKRKPRTTKE